MRIVCIGGGPGGLYFAMLMKKADPRHEIRVIERNLRDQTFGFGVVFSDATMAGIADADSEAYGALGRHLARVCEVLVVVETTVVTEAQVSELMAKLRPLLVEGGAQIGQRGFARHERNSTCGGVAGRAGEPRRRPFAAAPS